MTINKSLSILGLTNDYTEEELKKAYHRLSKLNHPDYHANESQEELDKYTKITQDINLAYEALKDDLKKKKDTPKDTPKRDSYLDIQIIFVKSKLNSYCKSCDGKRLMILVSDLINKYNKELSNIKSNLEISSILNTFKYELDELYKDYGENFAKKHKIPNFLVLRYVTNFDCDCKVFYGQLQSSLKHIDLDIIKILSQYNNKEHYIALEEDIKIILSELKNKLHDIDITEEEYKTLIEIYQNKIEILFRKYERKYNKFITEYNKVKHKLNLIQRKYIENNISGFIKETETEEITLKLNELINPQDKKILIYNKLRKKYLENVDKYLSSDLFLLASNLLYEKETTEEVIKCISNLLFINPEKEIQLLKNINSKENKTANNSSMDNNFYQYNIEHYIIFENKDENKRNRKI